MEYEALITEQDSPLDVLYYLKATSTELNQRIGGAVCPSTPSIEPCGPRSWVLTVKWALPMDNFALPGAPDPDELALWIIEKLPPHKPASMSSSKGVFMDLDMTFFQDLTRQAFEVHSQAK